MNLFCLWLSLLFFFFFLFWKLKGGIRKVTFLDRNRGGLLVSGYWTKGYWNKNPFVDIKRLFLPFCGFHLFIFRLAHWNFVLFQLFDAYYYQKKKKYIKSEEQQYFNWFIEDIFFICHICTKMIFFHYAFVFNLTWGFLKTSLHLIFFFFFFRINATYSLKKFSNFFY